MTVKIWFPFYLWMIDLYPNTHCFNKLFEMKKLSPDASTSISLYNITVAWTFYIFHEFHLKVESWNFLWVVYLKSRRFPRVNKPLSNTAFSSCLREYCFVPVGEKTYGINFIYLPVRSTVALCHCFIKLSEKFQSLSVDQIKWI